MGNQLATVEVRVLTRLVRGENYLQIATAEYLSSRTVRRVVYGLKRQIGATNVAGLCVEATRRGWLKAGERA